MNSTRPIWYVRPYTIRSTNSIKLILYYRSQLLTPNEHKKRASPIDPRPIDLVPYKQKRKLDSSKRKSKRAKSTKYKTAETKPRGGSGQVSSGDSLTFLL